MESQSMVEMYGRHWTKCGYCKPTNKTSVSYGLLAKRLTCEDYQELIDRGWRRSGTFVYKPVMHETCCPQYTIRLDVSKFKPTKSQRHVLNRLRRYLDSEAAEEDAASHKKRKEKATMSPDKPTAGRVTFVMGQTGNGKPGARKPLDTKNVMFSNDGFENTGDNDTSNTSSASSTGNTSNSDTNLASLRATGRALPNDASSKGKGSRKEKGDNAKRGGAPPVDPEWLAALSRRVAIAAALAVVDENGVLAGVALEEGWEASLPKWSQVRPIRSKTCQISGGGYCSTVALSIASAARKRGWKGGTGGGEALGIAKAVADCIVNRGEKLDGGSGGAETIDISDVTVAPNGFINFAADSVEALPASEVSPRTETSPSSLRLALPTGGGHPIYASGSPGNLSAGGGDSNGMDVDTAGENKQTGGGGTQESLERSSASELPGGISVVAAAAAAAAAAAGGGMALGLSGAELGSGGVISSSLDGLEVRGAGSREEENRAEATSAPARPGKAMEISSGGQDVDMKRVNIGLGSFPEGAAAGVGGRVADFGSSGGDGAVSGLGSLPPLDPSVKSHRMTVSTVPARLTDEVFRLYRKYQITVHGDHPAEVTAEQFRRFLVDSPLIRRTGTRSAAPPGRRGSGEGQSSGRREGDSVEAKEGRGERDSDEATEGRDSLSVPFGSYHQLYRIDGRLVAVGVVDILPKCLSSVYCFYDPDYRALALGKLTALKETEFVRQACELRPAIRDYYMGYYIHTCPKMSYKGSYSPSFLLCPERLTWVPLEFCRPVLDRQKYARLSDLIPPPLPSPLETLADCAFLSQGGVATDSHDDGIAAAADPSKSGSTRKGEGSGSIAVISSSSGGGGCANGPSTGRRRASPSSPALPVSPPPSKRAGGRGDGGGGGGRASGGGGAAVTGNGSTEMDVFGADAMEMPAEAEGAFAASTAAVEMKMKVAARRAAMATRKEEMADEALGIHDIPLSLGMYSFPVTLEALTGPSQAMLKDALRMYATALGPHLTRTIILKLYD